MELLHSAGGHRNVTENFTHFYKCCFTLLLTMRFAVLFVIIHVG